MKRMPYWTFFLAVFATIILTTIVAFICLNVKPIDDGETMFTVTLVALFLNTITCSLLFFAFRCICHLDYEAKFRGHPCPPEWIEDNQRFRVVEKLRTHILLIRMNDYLLFSCPAKLFEQDCVNTGHFVKSRKGGDYLKFVPAS